MGWVGWLVGKLITLICANFHHLRNLLSITSPSKWQLNYHWDSSFQRNKIIMLTTAISDFTLYLLLLLSMASSNFITYHFLSLLSPSLSFFLFLLTDVLNQWHLNSFTAPFLWAWGFVADALRAKSFSSREETGRRSHAWESAPLLLMLFAQIAPFVFEYEMYFPNMTGDRIYPLREQLRCDGYFILRRDCLFISFSSIAFKEVWGILRVKLDGKPKIQLLMANYYQVKEILK